MKNLTKIQEIETLNNFVNSLPTDSYIAGSLKPIINQIIEGIKQDLIFDPNAEIEHYKGLVSDYQNWYSNEKTRVKNLVREVAELKETVELTEKKLSDTMYKLTKIQDYCR